MDQSEQDRDIRSKLTTGDVSALELIWDRFASDLLAYLCALMCSRQDAEDTLQDVFLIISKKRTTVAKAKNLKAYLFRLARNTAFNRIKKEQRRRKRMEIASPWLESIAEAKEPEEHPLLSRALAKLPEKQRVIIVLKHYRKQTFAQISDTLGISANTAASRYRYGIVKLKTLLMEQEHES